MLILTATSRGQGQRDNDYHWAIEGELVWLEMICATDKRDPDGGCGCGRGFGGLSSHRGTTTALVRDLPMTREDVVLARLGYLKSAGWGTYHPDEIIEEVDEMLAIASRFRPGDIVERRLDDVRLRVPAARR